MKRRSLTNFLDRLAPGEGLTLAVMALAVGAGTGLAAVVFIRLIALIHQFAFTEAGNIFPLLGRGWFIVIPVIGALLGGPIIAYFATEAKGHGVPEVMQALILRGGRIRPRVALAKICASALCIGTGGSAGREGPIVQVGSTLGSLVGQLLHLSEGRVKNLVACGAAAGIAATFNAPIAGVIFATEVLMSELHVDVFGNVVIAAVSASIVSRVFLGARPAFEVPSYVLHSSFEIVLYLLLGLLAALVGLFFIGLLNAVEDIFEKWKFPQVFKPAVGALLLGVLAYCYPHLSGMVSVYPTETRLGMPLIENVPHIYGSGFSFLDEVLQGRASLWLLLMLTFLKPLATALTLGSGNSGGVFAPSLFTGAMLGGTFGHFAGILFPEIGIEVGAYALVGMAAVFAAAARAPLTSILIVFEMSNDYHLILPLMAAGMVAAGVAQRLYPDSIYTAKLTKKGIRFESGRDLDVMQTVVVEEVMNRDPVTIREERNLAELFALFQETHLHGFPVMADDALYGMVSLSDLEKKLHDLEQKLEQKNVPLKDYLVKDVATPKPVTVFPDEPIWAAIRKMAPRDLARMPVVSRHDDRRIVGLISRSDILRAYNIALLRKQQDQRVRGLMTLRNVAGVQFIEIRVSSDCDCVGKQLAQIKLPHGANVVSLERRDGTVFIPHGGTMILAGDFLTILCRPHLIPELRKTFSSQPH